VSLPSGEGIVRAVELGIGVAIVSRLVAIEPVRTGRVAIVRLRDVTFARTFRAVRLRRQTPSPAALAFIEIVRGAVK
jgi:DNA-binding transcriptional LysR family regulator